MNEILYYLQDRLESENNKPNRKNHQKKLFTKITDSDMNINRVIDCKNTKIIIIRDER